MSGDQEAVPVPVGGTRPTSANRPVETERSKGLPHPAIEQAPDAAIMPLIDIYEGPDGLVLEADLPGVPDDQLSIQLEDNVLNLQGKVMPLTMSGAKVLHEEYRPGHFWRSFILSDEVDRSRITASLKNGVLRITLPKADRARTRRIEIKTS